MDMGQCNDAYSAIQVALALANAFGCSVNDLPLSMVLSWYEQKAVCILLTLLYLGIQNIRLGPTLPAFLSPNVLKILVENYGIAPITTPEEDLKQLLQKHNPIVRKGDSALPCCSVANGLPGHENAPPGVDWGDPSLPQGSILKGPFLLTVDRLGRLCYLPP